MDRSDRKHWKHLYEEIVATEICCGCSACIVACPHKVLEFQDFDPIQIDPNYAAAYVGRGILRRQQGQGALALECRADDGPTRELLAATDDAALRQAVTAERTFLATFACCATRSARTATGR